LRAAKVTVRTAASIDGAEVVIMEQLGHFPMSENPAQFRRYIAPVLDRIVQQNASRRDSISLSS